MEMKCSWRTLRFIIITCMTVVKGQKSQHLVLSEPRKTGIEGNPLQVNCTAHVTSALDSLKWIPIHEDQSGIQQSFVTNTTVVMTISSLQGSHAGRYKCLLIMADGTEETAEFELMVRRKDANSAACSITQFKCKKTKHCIFLRYRCDGKDDCGDASDEDCESNPCLNKFRCNNSRCIDNQEVCNHVDNCGDHSDEGTICFLGKLISTTQPMTEDNQFGWLKITMSTVIASTVGAVILISFIVIVVFRVKMKRQREQRIARALEGMYRHGESREATSSGQGDEAPSDQRPFLPSSSHHYGNIIVNVNNGVQYLPGYDYSLFVAVPPPYSECSGADLKSQPPPYSTLDRSNTRQQTCEAQSAQGHAGPQSISISSVQNCATGVRNTEHTGAAVPRHTDPCICVGNANNSRVYHGGSQVQDWESLSGITPRFLQSLLGSQCEASPATGGYSNCFQSLPAPADGWPARGQVGTHILQARVGVMNSNSLSRPAPNTISSSTQTSQHQSLVSTPRSPEVDADAARQDIHVENMSGDQDQFVHNRSMIQHVTNIPDVVVAEHGHTVAPVSDNTVVVRDLSRAIHQNPVSCCDTGLAVLDSPGTVSPVAENGASELDDLSVPLLRCHQHEESLSDRTCSSVRTLRDRFNSEASTAGGISDCLLLLATDNTSGCIASVSEVSQKSQDTHSRPSQETHSRPSQDTHSRPSQVCGQNVIHTDGGFPAASLASAARKITSLDHRSLVVRDKDSLRLDAHVPTDCADVPPRNAAGHQSELLLNPGASGDASSVNSLSLQQSSIDQTVNSSFGLDASGTADNKHPCSGELNIHNGSVILEASRHTASTQILSGLHDVYAAEQPDTAQDSIEPVLNTKRPASVITRPALPKFNSDFVLPYRNQPL